MEPEKGYVAARGWEKSQAKIEEAGVWGQIDQRVMNLQWGGLGMVPFADEQTGCGELNLGKDFYENMDFGVDR
jgi:hypothetical protein